MKIENYLIEKWSLYILLDDLTFLVFRHDSNKTVKLTNLLTDIHFFPSIVDLVTILLALEIWTSLYQSALHVGKISVYV